MCLRGGGVATCFPCSSVSLKRSQLAWWDNALTSGLSSSLPPPLCFPEGAEGGGEDTFECRTHEDCRGGIFKLSHRTCLRFDLV